MVLCFFCDGVPLKFDKKNKAGLQFTSTDYLSIVLTPGRIRRTVPLKDCRTRFKDRPFLGIVG